MVKKSKVQARKRVATKDLAPKDVKDVKNVKGGKVSGQLLPAVQADALIGIARTL
jgi:hypothetical protein